MAYLREATSNVVIHYDELQRQLTQAAERMIDGIRDRREKVTMFQPEPFMQRLNVALTQLQYPLAKNLLRALQSKNPRYIFDQQNKLRDWIGNLKVPYQQTATIRELSREIWTFVDAMDQQDGLESSDQEVWQFVQQAMAGSQQEMERIKGLFEQAISRIAQWNGSPVIIEPVAPENEYGVMLEAADCARVYVGTGDWAPLFSFFQFAQEDGGEKKIEIEDICEDDDFFHVPGVRADYFNLINELRKPGSTNQGKMLTLYTARPQSDREMYLNQRQLPDGIFLTNSYDHAEGIAIDLGGSQGMRDIWKVRMDSRYLTLTLDGPVKYYQVTAANAPVKSMELVYQSS